MALSERRPDTRLADLLGETGGQWDVVLDVPVGDDLIDAVLVGPRGLLAISAADTTSGATISGRSLYTDQETRSDLVRMTWVRAHRLATRLDHSVDAVLCLMNDRDLLGYVGTHSSGCYFES